MKNKIIYRNIDIVSLLLIGVDIFKNEKNFNSYHKVEHYKHCVSCKDFDFSIFQRVGYILWRSQGSIFLLWGLGCIKFCGGLRGLIQLEGRLVFCFWRCIFLWLGLLYRRCGLLRCFCFEWERI